MSVQTKVVMLGSGTPNSDPDRSGPSVAVVVGNKSYLVDCGPGVVRRATQAYRNGVEGLKSSKLNRVFITHLHSDHTGGYPDLILTPWVLERSEPLQVFGPTGLKDMTKYLLKAYSADISERLNGFEEANNDGIKVEVSEITGGIVYEDELVKVEAIPVIHGTFDGSFAYKFYTPNKIVVISGDTYPCDALIEAAKECDILVHEVYHTQGVESRAEHWKKYHTSVHTSAVELGQIATKINPKLLVMYHHLFMIDINTYSDNLLEKMDILDKEMIDDVKLNFTGEVISSKDLDVY